MTSNSFFQQLLTEGNASSEQDYRWLYRKNIRKTADTLSFRIVSLKTDLAVMHRWANHPHAKKYWQMDKTSAALYNYYFSQMDKNLGIVLLCCLNDALPLAQIDIYHVIKDELGQCYEAAAHDYGVHLLMAPYREILCKINLPLKKPAVHILKSTVELLFAYNTVQRIIVEPDKANTVANRLAQQAGFTFMKTIKLSYKVANLYQYKRSRYTARKARQLNHHS